ncbi:N-formylglutamate amidohydrolase [Aquamicrobium sp. LC103]|uniref:N-formylglutamate amidohydrolase n=1 Tax=Aquamicrobium sp. LC103 TaxID=1120658 RepID=UPI00063EBCE9|nr:N-formylglutamate amidohydrolase [Aquamicrobium sp. LC103]TKT78358.1 N-formylglutamate amidohydrolase [Aquamicrobium sp. LC103]
MSLEIQALDIDGVLSVVPPRAAPVPLVFDSPHSGLSLPADFRPAVSAEMVRIASDTHVDDLFGFAPDLGAPLLIAQFPRSFLDVNRSLKDVDLELVNGQWPHPVRDSPSARRGMGLVWRYAWGDVPMYEHPMSVAELEARIDRYWRPYHGALVELLDANHAAFGCVYHINCHSMPAIGHKLSPDPAGTVRADMVIGDYEGTSCEPGFVALAAETLKGFGYSVALNVPFKGAELISAYSDPSRKRNSIQIELNRRLYMDEATRERTADYAELRRNLMEFGAALKTYALHISSIG